MSKKNQKKKLRIDLKWPEMRSKVICGHPKLTKKVPYGSEMARIAIESEFRKSNMVDRSEMARNAIESEFRTSKMAAGSHFVKNFQKKLKLLIDLKWPEMRSKVNFGHPKWPTSAILSKISKQIIKVAYRSEMARNAIKSEIRTSKMADVSHFVKNFKKH